MGVFNTRRNEFTDVLRGEIVYVHGFLAVDYSGGCSIQGCKKIECSFFVAGEMGGESQITGGGSFFSTHFAIFLIK